MEKCRQFRLCHPKNVLGHVGRTQAGKPIQIFDLQEAADYLGKTRRWLRENCVGLIEHERVGRGFRFTRSALDRLLAQHRRQAKKRSVCPYDATTKPNTRVFLVGNRRHGTGVGRSRLNRVEVVPSDPLIAAVRQATLDQFILNFSVVNRLRGEGDNVKDVFALSPVLI
jgi:hypothetical protein